MSTRRRQQPLRRSVASKTSSPRYSGEDFDRAAGFRRDSSNALAVMCLARL
jgi:hypothetical protein